MDSKLAQFSPIKLELFAFEKWVILWIGSKLEFFFVSFYIVQNVCVPQFLQSLGSRNILKLILDYTEPIGRVAKALAASPRRQLGKLAKLPVFVPLPFVIWKVICEFSGASIVKLYLSFILKNTLKHILEFLTWNS